jgi:hypothetical protein|tara:strand:+ start:489 stop:674 length:186 start_codon:yes stop_codon:yes gene_type:complete
MTKKILNTINIKRTMNLNSKSDKISGNIFMKKKTFKLSPKKTTQVKAGQKITGKVSFNKKS